MIKSDQASRRNQVFQDKIWRDYIGREWWSTVEWPKKYGFLAEESIQLQKDIMAYRKSGMTSEELQAAEEVQSAREIAAKPDPNIYPGVPETTSRMVGYVLSKQKKPDYQNGYSSNVEYRNFLDPPTKHGRKKLEHTLGIPAEAMN